MFAQFAHGPCALYSRPKVSLPPSSPRFPPYNTHTHTHTHSKKVSMHRRVNTLVGCVCQGGRVQAIGSVLRFVDVRKTPSHFIARSLIAVVTRRAQYCPGQATSASHSREAFSFGFFARSAAVLPSCTLFYRLVPSCTVLYCLVPSCPVLSRPVLSCRVPEFGCETISTPARLQPHCIAFHTNTQPTHSIGHTNTC
ncbi:unnamed protein product [Protopolystoma xenopodis]|uniref:Uncharacterized protein n=1 Tax=Protopolystoma xenopodis TaxID=117903 RepID=A0A3S5FF26_9PLAT|nr:unnamed protein product [Protopolystoma xenopodis]